MCEVELQSGGASEMSNAEVIASRLLTFNQMYSYEKRLQTFSEWPFREDCQCTPELVSVERKLEREREKLTSLIHLHLHLII